MANALTGDFDAVLEVSAKTIQRLLASMHKNDRDDPDVPSLPHLVGLHLDSGDVHGRMTAQVGVPIVSLVHGSTDTFHLELGIRARFVEDPGSARLAELIHGTIGADYRMEPVDASCSGWGAAAADHVWLRVVRGSVTFRGTSTDELVSAAVIHDASSAAVHARITQLVEELLTTAFEATPHQVAAGFRPGHLVQLAHTDRPAVAIPAGLDGGVPAGDPRSITQAFIGEADVALAISRDVILGHVQEALDDFRQRFGTTIELHFTTTIAFWDVIDVDIAWAVRVHSATATWVGPTSTGGGFDVDVHVHGGGSTQKHEYDWTFDVDQRIHLSVDAGSGWLTVRPVGEPSVSLGYDGPYAAEARAAAQPQVTAMIRDQIQGVTGNVRANLGLLNASDNLSRQLHSLDQGAGCGWYAARCLPDGLVVLGAIRLRPADKGPRIVMTKDESIRGYSALGSWMPAGRIDAFEWTWTWADGSRPPGGAVHEDRWLIQRFLAPTASISPWGVVTTGANPVPGFDGPGEVKLRIRGVYVDDETGDLVDFSDDGQPLHLHINIGDYQHGLTVETIATGGDDTSGVHLGVTYDPGGLHGGYDLSGGGGGYASTGGYGGSNVLVVRPGAETSTATLAAQISSGLAAATTEGAGLQIVVLHPEGRLDAAGIVADAQLFHDDVGRLAPTFVSQDVGGTWADGLGLAATDHTVLALLTPTGGVSWLHEGELEGPELGDVLDGHLVPAPSPTYPVLPMGIRPRDRLGPWALYVGSGCPPPPLGRLGRRAMITFLQPSGSANDRTLDTIRRLAPDPGEVFTAVVVNAPAVDGAPLRRAGLVGDAVPIADPDGTIAARFGIRAWPTTVLLDERGVVTKVFTGAEVPPEATRGRRSTEMSA